MPKENDQPAIQGLDERNLAEALLPNRQEQDNGIFDDPSLEAQTNARLETSDNWINSTIHLGSMIRESFSGLSLRNHWK